MPATLKLSMPYTVRRTLVSSHDEKAALVQWNEQSLCRPRFSASFSTPERFFPS